MLCVGQSLAGTSRQRWYIIFLRVGTKVNVRGIIMLRISAMRTGKATMLEVAFNRLEKKMNEYLNRYINSKISQAINVSYNDSL